MRVRYVFAALAPLNKRIDHLPDNRPRANNRHLHHDVIETLRAQARQAGHLRAALDLEHADGVGFLQSGINLRIIRRQMGKLDFVAIMIANQFNRILQHGHHPEAKQIDLDDAQIRAIIFVPLHHHAARHGCGFQRDHGIELALADHHAAGVLPEVTRQILHGHA